MTIEDEKNRLGMGGNNPPEPTLKERLTATYAALTVEVNTIAGQADLLPKVVKTDDELDKIGVVVKDARGISKRLEDARKTEKKEFDDKAKEVQNHFKPVLERLERIAETLEGRATIYQREKLAEERRVNEEKARKLRAIEDAARAKADTAAAAGKATTAGKQDAAADLAAQQAAEHEDAADAKASDIVRTRGASGTLSTAKTSTNFRIADINKVNLETLRPYLDREAIDKAIRTLIRLQKTDAKCDGVEFFEDVKASFR